MSTAAPAAAVRFDDLHMVFVNALRMPVHALRGFSMEIPEGAVVGLLGPNGSGKTTAISCLLGLLRPQRGSVFLFGERVGADLPTTAQERIGVLLEDTRLPPFVAARGVPISTTNTGCTTRRRVSNGSESARG